MHTFFKSALTLTILAVWAAPVYSANKVVPEEGAIELMLLRQQSVQKELKLADDQITKVNKHCAQQWEKARAVSKLSEKEQDAKFNEMSKENELFVESTLNKEQVKRLHQITLQVAGLLCVTRHDVASKLKLTEEQKKRLPQLHKEARQEAEEWIYVTEKDQRPE